MKSLVGRETELQQLRRVLAVDGPRSVVVSGGAGVGKSRLLQEIAKPGSGREWLVLSLYGSRPLRSIPMGAVSHLVQDVSPDDPSRIFHESINRIRREALGRNILLAVDDCHDLDDGSTAFVHQLVAHGDARAVLTIRSDAIQSETVTAFWADSTGQLLELGPLDRDDADRLARQSLRGPVEPRLLDELHQITLGNPLYLLTCIRAAREKGSIELRGGAWQLVGPLASSRLNDLILARAHDLSDEARKGMHLVAVCGPLPVALFEGVTSSDSLPMLLDRGLVEISTHRETLSVLISHPLYTEAIAGRLTETQRRALLTEAATSILDMGTSQSVGKLQATVWLLEAEQLQDHDLAIEAAREAGVRLDYELAERMARVAIFLRPDSVPAGLALGRALANQGRVDDALDVLGAVQGSTDEDLTEIALARGHALAFVQGRPNEAAAILKETGAGIGGAFRTRLDAERALYHAMAGDFRAVFDTAGAVLENADASDVTRVSAYVNYSLARAMTALLEDLDELMDRGLQLADARVGDVPLARHQLGLARLSAWSAGGRLIEGESYARQQVMEADAVGSPNPLWLAWLGYNYGIRGQFDAAIEAQTRALSLFEVADPFRLWAQSVGLFAMHQAQIGSVGPGVHRLLEEANRRAGNETRLAVWVGRGGTWINAMRDSDFEGAASHALAVGAKAIQHDHVAWGVEALHDAVRLGHPTAVRRLIEEAVRETSSAHLLEAMRDHANALDDGDTTALREASSGLARCGSPLLAAEASAQLARVHVERGEGHSSQRAAFRAELWHRQCPTAATPAITPIANTFTPHKLRIVEHVAKGLTSREIGQLMYVSARTIDNHLYHLYRRLGVSGRQELAAVISDATTPPQSTGRL